MTRDESFRERIAEAIAEAHDLDSGVDAVMRIVDDRSFDYSESDRSNAAHNTGRDLCNGHPARPPLGAPPICACPEGPHIGTQAAGEPVRCERCGSLAPTGYMMIDPSVVKVFGVDDHDVDWAAYGRQAFLQNWRKRAERAEAEVADMQGRSRAMARAIDRGLVAPESIASELLAILDRVVRDNGRRHDLDDVIAAFGFTREDLEHEDSE